MRRHLTATACLFLALATAAAAQLQVVATAPAPHSLTADPGATIRVRFDRPVLRSSVVARRSFWAFGRWSGTVAGNLRFTDGDRVVELRHNRPFAAGEMVTVFVSHDLEAADGSRLRPAGYSFQFWVRAQPAAMDFTEVDRQTTRSTPAIGTRSYGGIATDLDGDRYPDITVVNEDSDDLRVFINRGDGSGTYDPFLAPAATGDQPSPSEPADFDRDGRADIAVANFGGGVSILLGHGDGRFQPQQFVAGFGDSRGIAVLDADGDGDVDVVHTTKTTDLSLLVNDGSGVFGASQAIPAGGAQEWALGAADMNDDGILDLVTGDQITERIYVYAGNGDGTFTLVASRPSGGRTWMLVLGDLDGDGREDVTAVNGDSNNAAVLRGTGGGGLSAPQIVANDGFPLATDLGDLDGDGDLDWVTSSFTGTWRIFRNDGNASFTLDQELFATESASCALLVDVDLDGALDLALIDEIADQLVVLSNGGGETDSRLTVIVGGGGSGTVVSDPPGIDCGDDCTEDYAQGTEVTLFATPDPGSLFAGWSGGGCAGPECTVEMTRAREVTATFEEEIVCVADDTTLCLNGGRFQVRATWRDFDGNTGDGRRVTFGADDSGLFWFFADDNWEMLVKVLDGCAFNGRYWVFAAATTNVGYTLRVFDRLTGRVAEYTNPLGTRAAAITDTSALDTCP